MIFSFWKGKHCNSIHRHVFAFPAYWAILMFILIIHMKRRLSTKDNFSGGKIKSGLNVTWIKKKCISVGTHFSHQWVGQLNASISHASVEE